jgi:hypothetical protein
MANAEVAMFEWKPQNLTILVMWCDQGIRFVRMLRAKILALGAAP